MQHNAHRWRDFSCGGHFFVLGVYFNGSRDLPVRECPQRGAIAMMTTAQKEAITHLQKQGLGYRRISKELNLSLAAIKSYCLRHPVEPELNVCLQCGTPLTQLPHKKQQKFCSDVCRTAWWNRNRDKAGHQTTYSAVCTFCGKTFDSSKAGRRYCSRQCYADARRKAVSDE